jgi:hypothetical protein
MKRAQLFLVCGVLLLMTGISLIGASPGAAQGGPTTTPPPPITDPLGKPPSFLVNYYDAWVKSPHAKTDAEAFVHWNAEGKVPANCSTCHSTPGYIDFLGGDGTAAGKVEDDKPIGSVITCDACHDPVAAALTTVSFPSGVTVEGMGDSTRCMVCHQGRSSTVQVNAAIEKAGLTADQDKPSKDLRFINIHYFAAAATIYGAEAQGGYQYEGKSYQRRFPHVEGYDTCAGCHNPHTLEVRLDECATCHKDVKTREDLRNIRMQGSLSDYDGDGDINEGIYSELEGMREALYAAIQKYAADVLKQPIVYSSSAYPYFFNDKNANGTLDEGEAAFDNAYASFTARLEKAAYNYQVASKDPGNYAHNAAYHIELMYDSIESLNSASGGEADASKYVRNDPGHFDATGESFRHWDAEGEVPGSCAKCHTAEGLPMFLKNNATIALKPSNGLACMTCHDAMPDFTLRASDKVTFPSGAVVSFGEKENANLCLNCHQGRESTVSVNRAITNAKVGNDEVSETLAFRNIHYFAAGASLFGNDVKGAYQFEGKEYNGRYIMDEKAAVCTDCHDAHTLKIDEENCLDCHEDADTYVDIRNEKTVDFDGDGDTTEGLKAEIEALHADLLARIQAYAGKTAGAAIVYASANFPYWFIDTNGNGTSDPDELKAENRYNKWTPTLLRAAFNYQFVAKDPGQFTHNGHYILQILYDSIEAVGGADAVAKYARPEVVASK